MSKTAEDRIVARALLEMAKILVESDRDQLGLVEALYRRADELQPTAPKHDEPSELK